MGLRYLNENNCQTQANRGGRTDVVVTSPVAMLFDRVAATYETVGPAFFDHFGRLLVEHAGVQRGHRVLDLAAGSGAVSIPALAASGDTGNLLAVDLAAGMVERLSARLRASGHPDARAVVGDIAALELAPASVDVALCGFALFFLPEPTAALRSWARLLRPGGRLAVSTWGRQDAVFRTLGDEVRALGVDSSSRGQAYDDSAVLRQSLEQCGLFGVEVVSVSLDLVLTDVDELLRWGRTHGVRGWLDQLGQRQTERLRMAMEQQWPASVPMTWQAHLAVGTRPR